MTNILNINSRESLQNIDLTDTKLIFEEMSVEESIECIKLIHEKELELHNSKTNFELSINFKALDFKTRLEILKYAITNLDLIDSSLILNIFNLVKGYNTFDDSFFESEEIMINNLEEFLDIKSGLKTELDELTKEIARYYISILKTAGVTDFPANNLPKVMPFLYQRIFYISDFISLSNIIRKFTEVTDLIYVENAESYLNALANRYVFANILMQDLGLANKPEE